ncbi:MAG: glutathione S-transferase family protein [Alphaproteobacteria bacterium]
MTAPVDRTTRDRAPEGAFVRRDSKIRHWVTPDGAGGFKAEKGRYHLYVAMNCPWAHRALIMRRLKGLEDVIGLSVTRPQRTDLGWRFGGPSGGGEAGTTEDRVNGFTHLREAYLKADPEYAGRFTVPLLWDTRQQTAVNNESSEIIRMFNDAFQALTDVDDDYYPEAERAEIDRLNAYVYENVNNGVYRAGFATSQDAYESGYGDVFEALDLLDARLADQRYLAGSRLTEADWRLFPTLVRFDAAYHGAFKCNKRRLIDYANLWPYTRELYQVPGMSETVNLAHIKLGYWRKGPRNPFGTIPKGPALDFTLPHDRHRLPARPVARLSARRGTALESR